ncbi:MAG: nitrite reductase (NAD(P)H) small subunit, partial [Caulobacter sp.]
HAWNIDLATGEAMGADKGKGCAPVIALRVEDGRLLLSLDGNL